MSICMHHLLLYPPLSAPGISRAIQISRPRRFEAAGRRAFGSGTRCPQRVSFFRPPCAPNFRYVRCASPDSRLPKYDPPPSDFSGYPLRHLPKGPRPCPHVRARVHLPAATDLQLLLHGYNLQQADNDVRVMQGLTPRNVTECNEICQGARRRRRSGRVIEL